MLTLKEMLSLNQHLADMTRTAIERGILIKLHSPQPGKEKTISKLIAELFDGPIDIVGDIHGEINTLRLLLRHLGYDSQGRQAILGGWKMAHGRSSKVVGKL
jgi:hypothetical protein